MNFIASSSWAMPIDRPAPGDGHGGCRPAIMDKIYPAAVVDDPSLRANGRRHQCVVRSGPESTVAVPRKSLCGRAGPLERSDAPVRIGAQLCGEGVEGLERALDHGAVRGGLRSQETN